MALRGQGGGAGNRRELGPNGEEGLSKEPLDKETSERRFLGLDPGRSEYDLTQA